MEQWNDFNKNKWNQEINVSDFIKTNYQSYNESNDFLEQTTSKTDKVWNKCTKLLKEELKKGVLDIDVTRASGINSYDAGYIDKENEVIVGLQTDAPLKRIINPYGGIRMVYNSLKAYNYELDKTLDTYSISKNP